VVGEPSRFDASRAGKAPPGEPVLGQALAVSALLDDRALAQLRVDLGACGWLAAASEPIEQVVVVGAGIPERRRQLRCLLETALARGWDAGAAARLCGYRLGDLVPAAGMPLESSIPPGRCDDRLFQALRQAGWSRWGALLDTTVAELMSTRRMGARALPELLGLCFERGLEAMIDAWVDDSDPDAGAMGVVLRQERARGIYAVSGALLELRAGGGSARAGEAANELLESAAPWLDLEAEVSRLLGAAGDARNRELFLAWSALRPAASLEDLGARTGVSGQRAGQMAHRSGARIRAALEGSAGLAPWLVATVRGTLGPVVGEERAEAVLRRFGVGGMGAQLVLWLAGPYRPVPSKPDWLALEPKSIASTTASVLAGDGGVRRLVDVESELEMSGDDARSWLRACGGHVVHDLVLLVTGSLADVAERILDALGQRLTAAELTATLAEAGRATTEPAILAAARSPRFVKRRDGRIGLADWGDETADAKRKATIPEPLLEAPDGAASCPTTSVPPDHLAQLIDSPAAGSSAATDHASSEAVPPDVEERLWLWVRVDPDVLQGAEAIVPSVLADGLGLAASVRRMFSSRFGPVVLSHVGPQPVRGSVRAIALAAGAREGDTLLLGFSDGGDVEVDLRHATSLTETPGPAHYDTPFPHSSLSGGN
jgi:hypothetical protein